MASMFQKQLQAGALIFLLLTANSALSQSSDDQDLLTLIQLMETNIATKTDLQDPDRAPGLISVMEGGDLRARGYQNVADALHHIAGFDVTQDSRGIPTPSVRGIGGIRSGASGKIKVLIDGTEAYTVLSATGDMIYKLPINLVDKIEVIRGPGSVVHGENAYSAVVNVVTRSGDTLINLNSGSHNSVGVDSLFSHTFNNGLVWDLATSLYNTDGADVLIERDSLFNIGQEAISFAPGSSNELERTRYVHSKLNYQNLSLTAHWNARKTGDYYGLSGSLPPPENGVRRDYAAWYLEARYLMEVNKNLDLNFRLGYQDYQSDFKDITVQPPGFTTVIPPIPAFQFPGLTIVYPDGILATADFDEDRIQFSANMIYRGIKNHRFFIGADLSRIEGYNSKAGINLDIDNPNPIFAALPTPEVEQYPGSLGSIIEGQERDILSFYIQDEFHLSDRMWVTTGIRYDDYSDVGSEIVPRIAAVYELNEHNIIKAQYGEAFRPPTYAELFSVAQVSLGNRDIKPEKIDTLELAWIYKRDDAIFRATVFHSDLSNLIVLAPLTFNSQQFSNTGGAMTQGIEFETQLSLSEAWRLDANLSLVRTEDDQTGRDLEGATDLISNIDLIWQPKSDFSVNLRHRHVGERHRSPMDTRADLDSYQSVDLNINFFNLIDAGITLSVEFSNLLDEDIRFPSLTGTYPDDFRQDGRSFRLELSKTFK